MANRMFPVARSARKWWPVEETSSSRLPRVARFLELVRLWHLLVCLLVVLLRSTGTWGLEGRNLPGPIWSLQEAHPHTEKGVIREPLMIILRQTFHLQIQSL